MTATRISRRIADLRREPQAGSGALFAVFMSLVVMLMAGLVIDGGTALSMRQRASAIAGEAARKVAGDVDQGALRDGTVRIDPASCTAQADQVTAAYGQGTVTDCAVTGRDVTVTVALTYRPLLLGALDPGLQWTATAAATVHLAAGITTGS